MAQCHHLDAHGYRCPREAEDHSPFCYQHAPEASLGPRAFGRDLRKWLFRLAALALLLIFLLPVLVRGYRLLRALLN